MKQILNKLKENKKLLIPIASILLLLILVTGITFAAFNYSNDNAGNNDINSGQITMTYTEPSNEYVVENALPIKDEEGMNSTNYFEFSVTTKVKTNDADDNGVSIPYEISITESESNTLTNDKVKMYVTEVEGEKEIVRTNPTLVSYFEPSLYKNNQTKVGFNLHLHRNGNETITTKYRLRAWIDNNVDVSDWTDTNKYQFRFKVNVNGEATYQGYETDQSCFAYEKNVNGNYSITGYDFNKCGGKNIVIPEGIEEETTDIILLDIEWVSDEEFIEAYKDYAYEQGFCSVDVAWDDCLNSMGATEADLLEEYRTLQSETEELIRKEKAYVEANETYSIMYDIGVLTPIWSAEEITLLDIEWVSDEEFVEAYKKYAYDQGMCSADTSWDDCLTSLNTTEADLLAEYPSIKNSMNTYIGYKKTILEDEEILDSLNMLVDMGICSLEWSGEEVTIKILRKIDKIKSFANKTVTAVSNEKDFNIINNLNNITGKYKTDLSIMANTTPIINSLIIPENITITNNAFSTIEINQLVDKKGNFPSSCFNYTSSSNSIKITDYLCQGINNLRIPSEINDLPITVIGNSAFSFNKLTSVYIPNTITSIESHSFYRNLLTEIVIPESVQSIYDGAFRNNRIKHVVLPDDLNLGGRQVSWYSSYSDSAPPVFTDNEIEKIVNKDGVYPKSCFSYTEYDNEIDINGFYCYGVLYVDIPSKIDGKLVTSIGKEGRGAFARNLLTSISIPNSVKTIGKMTFEYNNLESVFIPNSVVDLSGFSNNQLTNVVIPNSVVNLSGFSNNQLTNVVIPNSVVNLSGFSNNQLTNVVIPNSVKTIGPGTFSNNKKLKKIVNKAGLELDWRSVINGGIYANPYTFITGTVTTDYGNVEIVSE